MRVGITYDLKTDWLVGEDEPQDANAEFDKPETLASIIAAFEAGGHEVVKIGNLENLLRGVDDLNVDIVFNICEGRSGRNRESQVPMILEWKGIPYVGSDALTLGITLDKVVAKKIFIAEGIPTPRFFIAKKAQGVEELNTIGYPLMVKTSQEGSSKGISEKSRVEDAGGLKRQVALITEVYHQPALVEEFIKGTEFTVAVLGNESPEAMPPVQVSIDGNVQLGDLFYTHARIHSDRLQYVCPPRIPASQERLLRETAVKAYQSVGCRDFGRVDFRVDGQGRPYVLEINPLPALGLDDVFNFFPQVIGSTYTQMLNRILRHAAQRHGMSLQEEPLLGTST